MKKDDKSSIDSKQKIIAEIYGKIECCYDISVDDIYQHLNEQTKYDFKNHPEKEYLKKILEDFCFIITVYRNLKIDDDCDIHHFSTKNNDPKVYRNMTMYFVNLQHREYKKCYELISFVDWQRTLATSIGYAIIREYERVFFR